MRALERRYPHAGDNGDHLALRLRCAREHAAVDEAAAANAAGISVRRLRGLEAGTACNDVTVLRKLAECYQVHALWLTAGAAAGGRFVPDWYRGGAA